MFGSFPTVGVYVRNARRHDKQFVRAEHNEKRNEDVHTLLISFCESPCLGAASQCLISTLIPSLIASPSLSSLFLPHTFARECWCLWWESISGLFDCLFALSRNSRTLNIALRTSSEFVANISQPKQTFSVLLKLSFRAKVWRRTSDAE